MEIDLDNYKTNSRGNFLTRPSNPGGTDIVRGKRKRKLIGRRTYKYVTTKLILALELDTSVCGRRLSRVHQVDIAARR